MAKALERFGTLKWQDVMAPALQLAKRGMELDWYMQVMTGNGAEPLSKFPASKATYLPDGGRVPTNGWQGTTRYLKLGPLGETYQRLSDGGPREYYEGALARDIAADLQAGGSAIDYDDLKAYEARIVEPLSFQHGGATINVAGGLTAGPTLRRTVELAGAATKGQGGPDADCFVRISQAMPPDNRGLLDPVRKGIAGGLAVVEVAKQAPALGFAHPSSIVRDPTTGELPGMNEVRSPGAGGSAQ